MKKLSLILALMAGLLLPLTAVADPDSTSQSTKSDQKKSSDKDKKAKKDDKKAKKSDSASAEPETVKVKMTNEQIKLHIEAIAAIEESDFGKAERHFVALLELGELNYGWYQLGNIYGKQNKCMEAYDAYSRVANAPILDDDVLTPDLIQSATQKGIAELDEVCSAKVVFDCKCDTPHMHEIMLSIDDGDEFACSSKPIPVVPGIHSVYARTSFGVNTYEFDAIKDKIIEISIISHGMITCECWPPLTSCDCPSIYIYQELNSPNP